VLHQNYPNPFNPSTSIEFQLSKSSVVTLTVYDLRGVRVRVLALNEKMDAGMHKVTFDGSNLSSGIYLYKLETPEFVQTRKMVLLK
jgi:flagellar hook assembly protein FlgD